jgi:uncharacterized protein
MLARASMFWLMAKVKNRHAAELSRLGSHKGGRARAQALSASQRSRIARRAAAARWGKPRYEEAEVRRFCERHHLEKLYLFGSILRDDFAPDSDVDVMIEYAAAPSFAEYVAMHEELEEIFQRRVDLVTRRAVEASASPSRRNAILSTATVVYAR